MIRFNSAGRVQAVEGMYLIHPGTCLLCGKVPTEQQEYFASLGVELEYYGMAYLCEACCHEIADFVGFVSPDRFMDYSELVEQLSLKNMQLQAALEEAKGLLDARIDAAGLRVSDMHVPDGVSFSPVEPDSDFVDSILNGQQSEPA